MNPTALKSLSAVALVAGVRLDEEHRINYGRLFLEKTYKADCSCGWTCKGDRERVLAAVHEHEKLIP